MHHVLITTTLIDPHVETAPVGISTVSVACESPDEALAIAQAVNSEPTSASGISHEARVLGLPVVTARDHELERLREQVRTLEALRPHWAQGYSTDSGAAQAQTAALAGLWGLLGVDNQTDAMIRVRSLLVDEYNAANGS